MSQHQTLKFRDGETQWKTSIPQGLDDVRDQSMAEDVPLSDFLARPVQIAQFLWDGTGILPTALNPWTLFFENRRVINRINNYKLLQCKLNVKFVINGNSFYFGRMLIDYQPLHTSDQFTRVDPTIPANAIAASQRMHIFLDPCTSQGGEFELPFIWYKNSLDVVNAEWRNMGQLNIRTLAPIKHANGATPNVEITVYAWASYVRMAVPTSVNSIGITAQSEYSSSSISKTMSSIASISGALSKIPIIGPYAKATQMVSSSMGALAKSFGFSRPVNLETTMDVRRRITSQLANCDGLDNVTKLTVDSKQELTIDPSIFGISTGDEMSIAHIAGIESYLVSVPWALTSTPGTQLFATKVHPYLMQLNAGYYYLPACAFATLPFEYWKGTMRFRFQIVASAYHKGRIMFAYDPNGSSTIEQNVQYSRLVDLANERDFTIDIPWGVPYTFLRNPGLNNTGYVVGVGGLTDALTSNGTLMIQVVNTLTVPNSTASNDISINVFVSLCDDVMVGGPTSGTIQTTTYSAAVAPQSDEVPYETMDADMENAPVIDMGKECMLACPTTDHSLDVHFGEAIPSFRTLLKRYNYHSSYLLGGATGTLVDTVVRNKNFPVYRGYYANGLHVSSTAASVNIVYTTLFNYLTPAFVGVRGGIRNKYMYRGSPVTTAKASINRIDGLSNALSNSSVLVSTYNTSLSAYAAGVIAAYDGCGAGAEVTNLVINPVIEAEFPFYEQARFKHGKTSLPDNAVQGNGIFNRNHVVYTTLQRGDVASYDRYIAVAEDFQLFLFQGAPPIAQVSVIAPG